MKRSDIDEVQHNTRFLSCLFDVLIFLALAVGLYFIITRMIF